MHDYYDGVARSTISDKTFTFVREQEYLGPMGHVGSHTSEIECRNFKYILDPDIIGFCGEIYPYIMTTRTSKHNESVTVNFSYTWEDFSGFVPIDNIKSRYKTVYSMYSSLSMKNWLEGGHQGYSYMDRFYAQTSVKDDPRLKEIFDKHKVAYFHIGRCDDINKYGLISYPILKAFQFGKVFDSYACFQKLEHFLTNELVKPDEINIIIPDNMKVQSHGFDKWSFRKEPLGKKRT